ncbi:MAG TPA: S41 family peptidase [Candidatus Krumholzibacteria bacterium]|nr:S41 family peptidase [Candidatus Krumholzibacteria bacterium]
MRTMLNSPIPPTLHVIARALAGAAAAFLLFGTAGVEPTAAQEARTDLPVDKAQRTRVIEAVAGYAEANYVFADLAKEVGRSIRKRNREGAYNDIAGAEALVARLTADLQSITPDRHLKVLFSAEPRPLRESTGEPSAEETVQRRLEAIRQNFGIERAEHLDGNVGYLKLTKFEDPALAGETIVAAMRFLTNTDALIIDLRYNGGGRSDMVALLTSYFFDGEPVHLADFYNRPTGQTSQSWTLPYVPAPRYTGKPLYILTGERTFSAAEQFTYLLQKSGRAVVVGQVTRGGAHFVEIFQIDAHFAVMVPVGDVKSPLTGSNWEGTGITPDVTAVPEAAVRTAQRLALEKLLESAEGRYADYLRMLVGEMKDETAPRAN